MTGFGDSCVQVLKPTANTSFFYHLSIFDPNASYFEKLLIPKIQRVKIVKALDKSTYAKVLVELFIHLWTDFFVGNNSDYKFLLYVAHVLTKLYYLNSTSVSL